MAPDHKATTIHYGGRRAGKSLQIRRCLEEHMALMKPGQKLAIFHSAQEDPTIVTRLPDHSIEAPVLKIEKDTDA